MITQKEAHQLREMLLMIDQSLQKKSTTTKVRTLTRKMRLLLSRAEKRENDSLFKKNNPNDTK